MSKTINISGQRFGFWVVATLGPKNKNGQTQWECVCECGTKKLVTLNSLRTGNSTSCGCNHSPQLINQRFGKLLVSKLDIIKHVDRKYWICDCDCGNNIIATTYQLRSGIITSCCNCKAMKIVETIILDIMPAFCLTIKE